MLACRFCGSGLEHTFVDLGKSPLCESYLAVEQLNEMEPFYPLHVYVCGKCFLVQVPQYVTPEHIFREYAYFSSYSDSWLEHARTYVDAMIDRFKIGPNSLVTEVGSNDGYLLQYFVGRSVPVLGIEPAENVAQAAIARGVRTVTRFFGADTASDLVRSGYRADLLIGNNVLAQVPDVNDFVKGIKILLKPDGVVTIECPHLVRLVDGNQFDTIYHEHFSYFSVMTIEAIFAAQGLAVFDVQELPTHGGSLRVFARHAEHDSGPVSPALTALRKQEEVAGLTQLDYYASFGRKVEETKRELLDFLIRAKREGKSIVGYGAPGKGNTLLNYCGIRSDFLAYTVDRNPYKQGKYLPGTHIPILHPDRIRETRPDYLLILPWNVKDEIMRQMAHIREWGGRFVVPIPSVSVS